MPSKPPVCRDRIAESCSVARVRCAAPESGRALAPSARFCHDGIRDGRLRRDELSYLHLTNYPNIADYIPDSLHRIPDTPK
jgi:hypothetical protein